MSAPGDKTEAEANPKAAPQALGVPVGPWVFTGIPFAPAQAGFVPALNHPGAPGLMAPAPSVSPTPASGANGGKTSFSARTIRPQPTPGAKAPIPSNRGRTGTNGGTPARAGTPVEAGVRAATAAGVMGRKRSASEMTALEKRQRRLEKNRESARECRRRKKEALLRLQSDVAMLEAENLQLRLKLKVGRDAELKEAEDSELVTQNVARMLDEGASEQQIVLKMKEMQEKFSDYGRDRISAIEFHLKELRRLLLPTMTTKVALWVLLQKRDDMLRAPRIKNSNSEALPGLPLLEAGAAKPDPADANPNPNPSPNPKPKPNPPMSAGPTLELIFDLKNALGITEEQIDQIAAHNNDGLELEAILNESDVLLEKLGTHVSEKNATLDEAMNEVQSVLTPTQVAKFVVWVANNPACMHMLNVIWNQMSSGDGGSTA